MSTYMPTLFDDEEFFVPPPKKESKAKKDKKKDTSPGPISEEAVAVPADTEKDINNIVTSEPAVEENTETEPANIALSDAAQSTAEAEAPEDIAADDVKAGAVTFSVETPPEIESQREESIIEGRDEAVEMEEEQEAQPINETSKEEETIALKVDLAPEGGAEADGIIEEEVERKDEDWTAPVAQNIQFEIPEEEGEIKKVQVTTPPPISGIKEEKVDDLDYLMRSEMIIQYYSAFTAFKFDPLPKKEEKKTEVANESVEPDEHAETIPAVAHIPIKDIDPETLTFDLDEEEVLPPSTLPEFVLENKYYTIGEVAAMFGANVSHIRFWTTEFKLKVRTTRKGDRLYNPENIARLRLIHHLVKENGYTIKGAKEKLKTHKSTVSAQVDLKEQLTGLKEKLERIKRNL
jgi:DNA-binding transcriptional MerR regulator